MDTITRSWETPGGPMPTSGRLLKPVAGSKRQFLQNERAGGRACIKNTERAFAETTCTSDLGNEVQRRIAPCLGGLDQSLKGICEGFAPGTGRIERFDGGYERIEHGLVADLG